MGHIIPKLTPSILEADKGGDEKPARNLAIFSQLFVKFEYLHNIQVLHPDYLEKNIADLFNRYFYYI